jgi:quercetin dioxygenase-like cupin family protein
MVEFQSDSIVSRILAKTPAGNVTLFAFDRGQELSEHTTPHEALIYVVEGAARIGVGGEYHHTGSGDLVRLPANVPHSVSATEPFKMLLMMLRAPGG